MNPTEETVTVPKSEYISLVKDSLFLEALQQGGVDNWEWYGDSLEPLDGWLKEDTRLK